MKLRNDGRLVPFLIILCVLILGQWIFRCAQAYEPRVLNQPTWEPPEIPYCEKETWERITDGCEDEHQ